MVWLLPVLVIPFGLTNTPLVFMDLLNQIFHKYLDFRVVKCTDNMLIYSTNCVKHVRHLKTLLEVLEKESWSLSS
jgi:hypothetical protein